MLFRSHVLLWHLRLGGGRAGVLARRAGAAGDDARGRAGRIVLSGPAQPASLRRLHRPRRARRAPDRRRRVVELPAPALRDAEAGTECEARRLHDPLREADRVALGPEDLLRRRARDHQGRASREHRAHELRDLPVAGPVARSGREVLQLGLGREPDRSRRRAVPRHLDCRQRRQCAAPAALHNPRGCEVRELDDLDLEAPTVGAAEPAEHALHPARPADHRAHRPLRHPPVARSVPVHRRPPRQLAVVRRHHRRLRRSDRAMADTGAGAAPRPLGRVRGSARARAGQTRGRARWSSCS